MELELLLKVLQIRSSQLNCPHVDSSQDVVMSQNKTERIRDKLEVLLLKV